MSGGFAGVFHFDGRPVSEDLIHRLTKQVAHRGPDAEGYWTGAGAAVGLCSFWTVPEAVGETDPQWDSQSGTLLVMDGRIDNREDLLNWIGCDEVASLGPAPSDARLLLAVYRQRGDSVFSRIYGEFAVAIWDARSRHLILARDRVGLRPLYYAEIPHGVIVASEIRAIVAHPEFKPGWNINRIAALIAQADEPGSETIYSHIRMALNCHVTRFTPSGRSEYCYWRPDLTLLGNCTADQYAELLRFELGRAIRACLRSTTPVATHLSGGLDSSSVTALAHQISPATVQPYSLVFPGERSDESFYIEAAERHSGFLCRKVPFQCPQREFADERIDFYRDVTAYPNFSPMFHSLRRRMAADGIRTVLTGYGGNAVAEAHWIAAGEYLFHGEFGALIADFFNSGSSASAWLVDLVRNRLRQVAPVPEAVRTFFRNRRRHPVSAKFYGLNSETSRRVYEMKAESVEAFFNGWRFSRVEQKWLYVAVLKGMHVHGNVQVARDSRHEGLDERHPFLDGRVIEYCLRIPAHFRGSGMVQKRILRRAMHSYLPPELLRRIVQTSFDAPSHRVSPPTASTFPDSIAALLDPRMLALARKGYRTDYAENDANESYTLWNLLALSRLMDC